MTGDPQARTHLRGKGLAVGSRCLLLLMQTGFIP